MITLNGVIDIFEAADFHKQSLQLINKPKVSKLVIDLSGIERIDLSGLQILLSIKKCCNLKDISFETIFKDDSFLIDLKKVGVIL
jgi:anti-anti-sigma factor